jgi:hypothetical protein
MERQRNPGQTFSGLHIVSSGLYAYFVGGQPLTLKAPPA